MSLSVDDLVASLNANHIGQEASDLAALQAQLAQTLFSNPPSTSSEPHITHPRAYAQPSNTPTSRTPSSSFTLDRPEFYRRRSSSVASAWTWYADEKMDREPDVIEVDEDERMVEDMLCQPSSPISTHMAFQYSSHYPAPPPASPTSHYPSPQPSRKHSTSSSSYHPSQHEYPPMNTSLFTTTDPFYLAQVQASQKSHSSYFTQAGRPSPQSPFVLAQIASPQVHSFGQKIPPVYDVEPHTAFVASAAGQ